MEHGVEFNEDETRGWTAAEKALNNQLISRSRELHALADEAERVEREADAEFERAETVRQSQPVSRWDAGYDGEG